ncbi:cytochrome-c peroxidase [Paraburkholderia caballeronis]|uniref:cytochrome-c peroxidase n=1 Tax=Paraburkholderia caballeronis TaxID=416943 RepID=UPI00106525AB|nr:cytochrome c peroxidase [Paraburkholderia caballeronis]TDV16344.1 cytochrome c peroxidase [Paraburkholderia caballeronis]TDV20694.1 cytochrome c peroxidase [Paraburkholderia caballeronis]TDV33162.1 cytochrome c peroxidase [Paraburkholderia caballeronis]
MSLRPDTALPPSLPSGGNSSPDATRKTLRRVLGWAVAVVAAGCAAFAAYAAIYPERMPPAIGDIVEDITGANPQPVKLHLPPQQPLSAMAQLGRQIFFDPSLSASGKQSCASCHSPDHAYGPPNDLSVQMGGPHLDQAGYRPPPSLGYLYRQVPFSIGPDLADDDTAPASIAQQAAAASGVQRAVKTAGVAPAAPAMVPQGGLFWDGRASTLEKQAISPMLNPVEMANATEDDVMHKLLATKYVDQFKKLFGDEIVQKPHMMLAEAMFAVGRFQFEDPSFHPFTSKYDYWLQGKARLTHAELRGLKLFNDPDKANCAGCHLSKPTADHLPPLFTDTQYESLGVPRNRDLPVNKNPAFYDMGVCGPFRTDVSDLTQYCGMFLTPTLRNVATRHAFFHNGVYHDLQHVMDFYNLRATNPEKIYPRDAAGKVAQYDDLPAKYHANVDVADAPFDRKAGDTPAMTDQDIKDIIAFIGTLNDGYKP